MYGEYRDCLKRMIIKVKPTNKPEKKKKRKKTRQQSNFIPHKKTTSLSLLVTATVFGGYLPTISVSPHIYIQVSHYLTYPPDVLWSAYLPRFDI